MDLQNHNNASWQLGSSSDRRRSRLQAASEDAPAASPNSTLDCHGITVSSLFCQVSVATEHLGRSGNQLPTHLINRTKKANDRVS